ncbi:hypothetical protein OPT61_g6623 [Boeremia exigua]|uniref:Uncharacterized protein n=1 Tax=Boeremia exigua TaxID=749465 RepID=A0ACC2I636_9PLEO|nr:hypothetical protein OPT61_g6623 [Boeremia exigua]
MSANNNKVGSLANPYDLEPDKSYTDDPSYVPCKADDDEDPVSQGNSGHHSDHGGSNHARGQEVSSHFSNTTLFEADHVPVSQDTEDAHDHRKAGSQSTHKAVGQSNRKAVGQSNRKTVSNINLNATITFSCQTTKDNVHAWNLIVEKKRLALKTQDVPHSVYLLSKPGENLTAIYGYKNDKTGHKRRYLMHRTANNADFQKEQTSLQSLPRLVKLREDWEQLSRKDRRCHHINNFGVFLCKSTII